MIYTQQRKREWKLCASLSFRDDAEAVHKCFSETFRSLSNKNYTNVALYHLQQSFM